jgi:hypothetical protein
MPHSCQPPWFDHHSIISYEEYKLWGFSSFRNPHPPVTSSVLDQNALVGILFSNTFNLHSSFKMSDTVSLQKLIKKDIFIHKTHLAIWCHLCKKTKYFINKIYARCNICLVNDMCETFLYLLNIYQQKKYSTHTCIFTSGIAQCVQFEEGLNLGCKCEGTNETYANPQPTWAVLSVLPNFNT